MTNKELIKYLKTTNEPILPEEITENETRDFKVKGITGKGENKEKAEFLKDILALVNGNGGQLACLYFGIDEVRDHEGKKTGRFEIVGVKSEDYIQADTLKEILRQYIQPAIHADFLTIENTYLPKTIQILKLEKNIHRPYMLKQTVMKGTEFVEGSKYYREMASSTRIPSTQEEHLFKKWRQEDFLIRLHSVLKLLLVLCLCILIAVSMGLSLRSARYNKLEIPEITMLDADHAIIPLENGKCYLRPGERVVVKVNAEYLSQDTYRIDLVADKGKIESDNTYQTPNSPGELDTLIIKIGDKNTGNIMAQQTIEVHIIRTQ